MKLQLLQEILNNNGLKVFSTLELQRLLKLSQAAAYRLLIRYEKKKIIVRLKRGLYALKINPPSSYLIANLIYRPSYISFDAAMSYHNLIPETIYAVNSATVKATREFTANGILYVYHRIKKEAFVGYKPLKYMGAVVYMADPEKAIADYLYFVDLGKRGLHYERINLKKVNRIKLIGYIKLFGRPGMLKLAEKIYAESRKSARIY